MANKIQLRRDTSANWVRVNPILGDGEPGLDITNKKIKYGDGSTHWRDLEYASGTATATGDPTKLVNGSHQVVLQSNGNLSLPQGGIITEDGGISGAIKLTPAGGSNPNQALVVYPTNGEGDHLHLTAGGGTTELYLGSDDFYVKLANTGGILVNSNDGIGNSATWVFGADALLTLPANGVITAESTVTLTVNTHSVTLDHGGTLMVPGTISTVANTGDVVINSSSIATWNFRVDGGIQMPVLTAAPTSPVTGTLYTADGVTWDPATKSGSVPYPVFYDGVVYQVLY